MNETGLILASFLLILCLAAALQAGRWIERRSQRLNNIERRISALEEKAELAPKRLANRTIAGIEDAQAILIDLLFQHRAEAARLDNLSDVLAILRREPNRYDPERPCGRRPEQ